MSDIYSRIRTGMCGPGGFRCKCCNDKPNRGNGKRTVVRSLNKRARKHLDLYLPTTGA